MTLKLKPYPKYKDSGIKWLREVPEHWCKSKVAWDIPYVVGWTPSTSNYDYYDGCIPWVTIDDLKGKYICSTKKMISTLAIQDKGINIVPKGSLLFSFKLSVGKVAFSTQNLYTNEAIASFLPNHKIKLSFLYYLAPYFLPHYGQYNIYGALLMNQELISSSKTFVPPPQEQTTIATYLDKQTAKIDKLIKNYQKLIELSKEKRTALITHCVTKGLDPTVKMKDSGIEWLGKVPDGWETDRIKSYFIIQKRISNHLDYNVLSITQKGIVVKDIDSGEGQLSMDYSKYQLIFKGEFGMNHMDLLTGYIDISNYDGVVSPDYRVFSINNQSFNTRFFLYVFQICYINKIFYQYGQGSSQLGRWRLPSNEFYNFKISVPPSEEQTTIATYLDKKTAKIDQTITKAEQAIELLKEKRTALITAAVTGKIDVRGYV